MIRRKKLAEGFKATKSLFGFDCLFRVTIQRAKEEGKRWKAKFSSNGECFTKLATKLVVPAIGRVALGGFWSLQRRIATSDVQLRLPELQRSIIFGFGAILTRHLPSAYDCEKQSQVTKAFGSQQL
ncbi:hypothetical protein CTI12_AA340130 [Artemisia annua]|uniref:Uncharacterized protein n=1 Tax=Artemisia annua TaxID=35608 RepID=A0A2U1MTB2_ARTAN|nr:hypothetical protein CTI12_AA340130 [Artemisia annua]